MRDNLILKEHDITGQRFGKRVVIKFSFSKDGNRYWKCKCDCGFVSDVAYHYLKETLKNSNKNQGCSKCKPLKHGHAKKHAATPEFVTWQNIKRRCDNPNKECFDDYGKRGIRVCDSWINSFKNFLSDMGKKPSSNHSIDRMDNDGDYEPANCRWATLKEQSRNKRNNNFVIINNEKICMQDACKKYNIHHFRVWEIVKSQGKTYQEAFECLLSKCQ